MAILNCTGIDDNGNYIIVDSNNNKAIVQRDILIKTILSGSAVINNIAVSNNNIEVIGIPSLICTAKEKNKYGQIKRYKIADSTGQQIVVDADQLKSSIKQLKVNVINMKLTNGNRFTDIGNEIPVYNENGEVKAPKVSTSAKDDAVVQNKVDATPKAKPIVENNNNNSNNNVTSGNETKPQNKEVTKPVRKSCITHNGKPITSYFTDKPINPSASDLQNKIMIKGFGKNYKLINYKDNELISSEISEVTKNEITITFLFNTNETSTKETILEYVKDNKLDIVEVMNIMVKYYIHFNKLHYRKFRRLDFRIFYPEIEVKYVLVD